MKNKKINWWHFCLGITLNILVIINFIFLYNTQIKTSLPNYNFSDSTTDKTPEIQKTTPMPTSSSTKSR